MSCGCNNNDDSNLPAKMNGTEVTVLSGTNHTQSPRANEGSGAESSNSGAITVIVAAILLATIVGFTARS